MSPVASLDSGHTLHVSLESPWTQDSPSGHDVKVERAKDKGNFCSSCFYCARGSFKGIKLHELRASMDQHDPVREKLLARMDFWTLPRVAPHATYHMCLLARSRRSLKIQSSEPAQCCQRAIVHSQMSQMYRTVSVS